MLLFSLEHSLILVQWPRFQFITLDLMSQEKTTNTSYILNIDDRSYYHDTSCGWIHQNSSRNNTAIKCMNFTINLQSQGQHIHTHTQHNCSTARQGHWSEFIFLTVRVPAKVPPCSGGPRAMKGGSMRIRAVNESLVSSIDSRWHL